MTEKLTQAQQFLIERQHNYQTTFRNPTGEEVLRDLMKFCRANETTFAPDERTHCLLEGRREVWLRIAQHLNLSQEDLWALYSRK